MNVLFCSLISIIGFVFPTILQAANWPAWRGPTGSGISTEANLPTQWSETENVKWKAPLPDRGNSTPVIWENKIFVSQSVEASGQRQVLCIDKKTGKELWRAGTTYKNKEESHRSNPYCSPSPVTDGERVIAWFGSAGLFCFDLNGRELWHRDLGEQSHEWGYAASPIIYSNLCILHFGPGKRSFLIAVDKVNGKTAWQVNIPEVQPKERTDGFAGQSDGLIGSWSTPFVIQTPINKSGKDGASTAGAQVRAELVICLADWVKGFDPMTGKELWRCGGLNPLIYSSQIYGNGVVVAMGGFHGTTIACLPGGSGDVTETHRLWQTPRTPNRLGSGIIHDGYIYVGNTPGIAECIELKTGKTVWEERLPSKGAKSELWSSFVLSGDKIYVLNQSGDCVIFRAAPKFEVIGVNSIGSELTNGSLAVSDGELLIRTHEHLWCISEQKRK